jgi:exonuclease SbcC
LSLTINSSNEFEIIDYLNNGASRSVKRFPEVRVFKPLYVWLFGRKRSILNKNDKTFLSMKALGPKILKVSFLKRCNRFIKRIELLELFRMLLSCKNEFRSINVFKDEEKGSLVSENWN